MDDVELKAWNRAIATHGEPIRDPQTGCLLWQGAVSGGYGKAGRHYAHILAYKAAGHEIPPGHFLDHVWAAGCRHKTCINVEHLEPVTNGTNVKRAWEAGVHDARRGVTHCVHGHLFTPENTRIYRGKRNCRTCQRNRVRKHRSGHPRHRSPLRPTA